MVDQSDWQELRRPGLTLQCYHSASFGSQVAQRRVQVSGSQLGCEIDKELESPES